jgi:hypothetical protein
MIKKLSTSKSPDERKEKENYILSTNEKQLFSYGLCLSIYISKGNNYFL